MTDYANNLLREGIAAFNRKAYDSARELFTDAVFADATNVLAWIWLSAAMPDAGHRRFCLDYVLQRDPKNQAAKQGLQTIPATVQPKPLFQFANGILLPRCRTQGCQHQVSQLNHTVCRQHWKDSAKAKEHGAPTPTDQQALLTASMLAERLNMPANRVNLMLAEIGWLDRDGQGWRVSTLGQVVGGVQRVHQQSGVPFVVWSPAIVRHPVIQAALHDFTGDHAPKSNDNGFRERFPATHRTTDGHLVRSKAEQLIDNWLYMAGIVHAYERRLPIEEEVYCDFYIPSGKVYVEFWGLENEPQYRERQQQKRAIYQKYGFKLIELSDEHVRNLDDYLPQKLRQFGIAVE